VQIYLTNFYSSIAFVAYKIIKIF